MSVAELERRLSPPVHVVADRTWDEVSRDLGVAFGPDFRAVTERYGRGYFDQGVTLSDPRRRGFEVEIAEVLEIMADPELRVPGKVHPHPPHPGPGTRLLPVAWNGSAGYLMATLVDGTHDESRYWIGDLDTDDFTPVRGPFSTLLVGLLTGSVVASRAWRVTPPFHPLSTSHGRPML